MSCSDAVGAGPGLVVDDDAPLDQVTVTKLYHTEAVQRHRVASHTVCTEGD